MTREENKMKYWSRKPQISVCLEGDNNAILFDPDTGLEKVINATGLIVWQAMDGKASTDALAQTLADCCDIPVNNEILSDVTEFSDELLNEGFAVAQEAPAEKPAAPEAYSNIADAPRDFDLSLTGKCNLHCAYCFYHDEMASRPDLSLEEWLTFFDELKRLGVRDATLSGGEVFVRPDLWALIDGLVDSRMRYSILSNGTLVNEKTLSEFEKNKRRRRLTSIQVSIDGSRAEIHDKSRGAGSFEKALRGLRLLKEAGFPVTVRVTVNRYNVEDLDNIARLLLDDVGLSGFGTNDAMPMGSGCDNQKDIVLTAQQQVLAMKTLARLQRHYNGRITATAGPLAKWHSYREMEKARKTGAKSLRWKMGYLTACGCVFNKLSVHPDGIITPCNMLTKLTLGHINRETLTDIWKGHPVLKALKDRRGIPMTSVPGCEDCEWAAFCNGSCPGLAYEMTGDVNRANPHDCYRRFKEQTLVFDERFLDELANG
jgi:SynChlorMet cassette radical SAM/SPASM protein ScmE